MKWRFATLVFSVALLLPAVSGAIPRVFTDDFDRPDLGPDWVVDSGSYATVSNTLGEISATRYLDAQMRYVGDTTESAGQFGKLQIVSAATHTFGFIFRAASSSGDHYEVHPPIGSDGWRWERYDPAFVERMGECTGDANVTDGDWIGATIDGSGPATVVSVYRWDSDPDVGGSVDITTNWGPPDCVITGAAGPTFIDSGDHVGVRAYTGKSKTGGFADSWTAGDLAAASATCGDGITAGAEQCDDGNGVPNDGCRGDCTLELCGDGILDAVEECDDGNAVSGDGCRGDCTAEICGDGIVDPLEECDDGNTIAGDGCDTGCAIEPPVTCGDGVLDIGLGEECDDGNNVSGDGCRANCTTEICGDGLLDPSEGCDDGNNVPGDGCRADCSAEVCGDLIVDPGEQCEVDADCSAAESCTGCSCAPPGELFSDDFDRASLGSDWSVDSGSFALVSNQLGENSGQRYTNAQLRYVAGTTATTDQFGKLQITSAATHTFGFLFRSGVTPGDHYQVHPPIGTADWRWERHDPGFVGRMADCVGDAPVGDGDWIGATIAGIGPATVVEVFRWDSDPDTGGPVNRSDNWGAPDCVMTSVSGPTFVDVGDHLGVRAYTGNSTQNGFVDSWSGGDLLSISAVCGDAIIEGLEECDDGNSVPGDGCRADCTAEVCGDGIIDTGETCDDGNNVPGDGCRADCSAEVCGDGIVDAAEACDDGNNVPGDGCRSDCTAEICGDGIVDSGEACDDGNGSTGDGCRPDCSAEVCGDGFLDAGEACDDGNTDAGDGCDASCLIEPPLGCGDGVLDPGEACDDGNNVPGDGCRSDCTAEICGDGFLDPLEACDDGNNVPGDGCRADCSVELCGDGILDPLETCDDGNNFPGDGCRADCSAEVCGDGFLDPLEECDDGNGASGDGCRADCSAEVCGDLILDVGEECEVDADCSAGDLCSGCACTPPVVDFADDFDRASLGADWAVDSGSYVLAANQLVENSSQRFTSTQMRYVAGTTVTPDQYGKLQIVNAATHTFGFMFRAGPAPGDHYEVHPPIGSDDWRWERYDPGYVERMGECLGDTDVGDGDWIGAAITGSGGATEVLVWRWDTDPDLGGTPDIEGNWGPPDCVMSGAAGPAFVDSGWHVGIRTYTGSSKSAGTVDDWFAGDFDGQFEPAEPPPVELILDASGAGTPNSLRDPDGVVVDSAGNVYVAGCGSGPSNEGVWKVDVSGTVTKILDNSGDGVNEASCPVGLALDSLENLYVACFLSDNAFRVTPGGAVQQMIGPSGAGPGAALQGTIGVEVDALDQLYVTGHFSHNVLVRRTDTSIDEILDDSDGLLNPFEVVVDSGGNAIVAGFGSDEVYRVTPGGSVDVILDSSAGGAPGGLMAPHGLALDPAGNLYITGNFSDNVLKRTPAGAISVILDSTGDGAGNSLDNPSCIATDGAANVYVAGFGSNNLFQVTPAGVVTEMMDATGDGIHGYDGPSDFCVAVDPATDEVYTTGTLLDNTFLIRP